MSEPDTYGELTDLAKRLLNRKSFYKFVVKKANPYDYADKQYSRNSGNYPKCNARLFGFCKLIVKLRNFYVAPPSFAMQTLNALVREFSVARFFIVRIN